MKRRVAAILLVLTLMITPALAFSDVGESDWYAGAVDILVQDGVLADLPGQPFMPDAPVRWGEFLSMALRAKGVEPGEDPAGAALRAGWLSDLPPAEALDRPISRCEAAEILWKATGAVQPAYAVRPKGGITDEAEIPARYLAAMRQCYLLGIFTGAESSRQFHGDDTVRRGEAALLIARLGHPERRAVPETETVEDFSQLLGECVTYTTSLADRNFNIDKAAKAINGTILEPGEQFSFYKVVGNPGKAEGYRLAPAIQGVTHVASYGGGLCQDATNLFNAALKANLRIDERHNHSLKSTYVKAGYDATIYFGATHLDLKFTNVYDSPIRVDLTFNSKTRALTCRIYGASTVKVPEVKLHTTGGGKSYTLYRTVDGKVNYTTKSTYQK